MTTPRITTDRLILEPITLEQVNDVHRVWSDVGATSWSLSPTHTSLEESRLKLPLLLGFPGAFNWTVYAAIDPKSCIGMISILPDPKSDAQFPGEVTRTLVYNFVTESWGKGYATEAVNRAIEEVLVKGGFEGKLVAWINGENFASQKVAGKLSMREEKWYRGGRGNIMIGGVMRPDACPLYTREF